MMLPFGCAVHVRVTAGRRVRSASGTGAAVDSSRGAERGDHTERGDTFVEPSVSSTSEVGLVGRGT